jgi:copper resistance protein C
LKKIILATFIFIFTISSNAYAHTHLGRSNPEDGQVVTEELKEITLVFEGKIEQTSKMVLSSSQGQTLPMENITIEDGKMIGFLASPMENGDYLVNWNIIGADGHPIEGEITFSVDVEDSEKPAETSNNETKQPEESTKQPEKNDEQNAVQESTEPEPDELPSYLLPVIIIVLILVVAGTYLGVRRKN